MALNFNEGARVLNTQLAGSAYTAPTAHSISLHTANPGSTDTPTSEVAGGSYARQNVSFGAVTATGLVAAATASNSTVVTFSSMPATTSTYMVLWNNAAGTGTPQMSGPLTASVTTTAGQTLTFAAGSITAQDT